MRQLQGVLWTKGTLLTPQHLQVQDRYVRDLVDFKLSSMLHRPWGLHRLEVDREALAAGTFALSEAAGVLPDGLPFDVPEADPAPPSLALDEMEADGEDGGTVIHLSVPRERPGAKNVAGAHQGEDARYFAETVLLRDENTGSGEKPVQLARKNLRLLEEGMHGEGGSSLPVARLTRNASGEFELDPTFVPPLLDFRANEHLMSVTRRLVEVLASRTAELAGARRQQGAGLADFGVSDVASFWLLYTLNSHLPVFRHLFEARGGHPARLFESMLQLAGALTTFSTDIHPRDLPAYDHGDPGDCFRTLDDQVHRLLATVIPQRHAALPLKRLEGARHATALDQDRYLRATQAFLAVRSSAPQEDVLRKVPQLVKVSSGDRIEQLIKQALPGITLRHVASPPEALPVQLDYVYFELERSGEDWDAVLQARNLAAYVPSDLPEAQLELVLLLPPEDEG